MRRRLGILEHNLSKRQAQILRAVVEAYVEGGEPVGSKYIAQTRMPNCSPATIRNEMAALEALGYLEQPHTSAGRIPSGAGYRFYVDCLADEYKKTRAETDLVAELPAQQTSGIGQYSYRGVETCRQYDQLYGGGDQAACGDVQDPAF